MKARNPRWRGERGQALVEFVLVLPLLLMLMIGIMQLGMLYNNWATLNEAVRLGARELSIARAPAPHPDACVKANNRINSAAIGLTTASITKSYTFDTGSSCTNMAAGSDATVSATYPCNLTILGIDYAPGCTLRSRSIVRVE